MKLHLDKDSFGMLIDSISERTGYRQDVLEKDYYVVLILHELSLKQTTGLPAYFKGGTALYKALKTTNRFSEDIDISVDTRGCTKKENNNLLKTATKKYTCLERDRSLGKTNLSEVISVYRYNPISNYDQNDLLQRFGFLKVEATSFTISEPVEKLSITPLLYDLAVDDEKELLEKYFDIKPFNITTITMERIFIDKLFAAESYTRKSNDEHRAFEAAKHIYDLSVMENNVKIVSLLSDNDKLIQLLDIRVEEEKNRLDGIPYISPCEFIFFESVRENKAISNAYEIMQKQYVLNIKDRISYENACQSLMRIYKKLSLNPTWENYKVK